MSFPTSIQHSIGSPSHSDQTRKRNKRHPNWKGGSKTVIVCRWRDTVYRKSYRLHQKTTRPNKFGKTVGYKINIQKSKAFLYTNNEISETEVRKKNLTWYSNMKNKVPMNKPNEGVKHLYSENYTTLKKEIKKDTNKWKYIPHSCIGRIYIIKMSILP